MIKQFNRYLKISIKAFQSKNFYIKEVILNRLSLFSLLLIAFVVNVSYLEDKNYAINYFLIATLINFTLNLKISYIAYSLVKSGKIASYLIKPFNSFYFLFFHVLGINLTKIIDIFFFSLLLVGIFGYFKFIDWLSLIKIPIVLLLSIFFIIFYYKILFYLTFIFEKVDSLNAITIKLISFLGGGMFSASIFGEWAKYTPFYYFVGFESDFILGKIELIHFLMFVFYLITLFILSKKIEKIAIRKIEINGG